MIGTDYFEGILGSEGIVTTPKRRIRKSSQNNCTTNSHRSPQHYDTNPSSPQHRYHQYHNSSPIIQSPPQSVIRKILRSSSDLANNNRGNNMGRYPYLPIVVETRLEQQSNNCWEQREGIEEGYETVNFRDADSPSKDKGGLMLPLSINTGSGSSISSSNNNNKRTRRASSSPPNSSASSWCTYILRIRTLTWLQFIFVSAIAARILSQFYFVHWQWSLLPSATTMANTPVRMLEHGTGISEHHFWNTINESSSWTTSPTVTIAKQPALDSHQLDQTISVKEEVKQDSDFLEYQMMAEIRRLQRIGRSRPVSATKDETLLMPPTRNSNMWKLKTISVMNHQNTDDSSDDESLYQWSTLCSNAHLSSESRVVITGILTPSSPAAALAMLLSNQCQVKTIAGVDPMIPNLRSVRLQAMKVFQQLYRAIPNFQLIVPTTATGLARKHDEWLEKFKPTHIIHFEPTATSAQDDTNLKELMEYMPETNQRLYKLKHSTMSLEQILRHYEMQQERPPRILHVWGHPDDDSNGQTLAVAKQVNQVLIEKYRGLSLRVDKDKGIAFQQLTLPHVYGPLVTTDSNGPAKSINNNVVTRKLQKVQASIFVDDAMAVMLQALQYNKGLYQIEVRGIADVQTTFQDSRYNQTLAYKTNLQFPHGLPKNKESEYPLKDLREAGSQYRQTYGIHQPQLPCASTCSSVTYTCQASPYDEIIQPSVDATEGCVYVLYVVDFSNQVTELFKPIQPTDQLCRVAFVSGKSPLVQNVVAEQFKMHIDEENMSKEEALQKYNGKLKVNNWKLVWLPNHDENDLNEAEFSLLWMDPGRFFANSVAKVMFTEVAEFAEPPDYALLRILTNMNRRSLPRHLEKEYRKGSKIFRFVTKEAERARSVAFFAAEPNFVDRPNSMKDYARRLEMNNAKNSSFPIAIRRQMSFYEQAAHWIQMGAFRPEDEVLNTLYDPFPFQWISMSVMIQDVQMEQARAFRCNWYDEHLFWSQDLPELSNRGADELSLAYVIAQKRVDGSFGLPVDQDQTWVPFVDPTSEQRLVNNRGAEVFLRIMKRD